MRVHISLNNNLFKVFFSRSVHYHGRFWKLDYHPLFGLFHHDPAVPCAESALSWLWKVDKVGSLRYHARGMLCCCLRVPVGSERSSPGNFERVFWLRYQALASSQRRNWSTADFRGCSYHGVRAMTVVMTTIA